MYLSNHTPCPSFFQGIKFILFELHFQLWFIMYHSFCNHSITYIILGLLKLSVKILTIVKHTLEAPTEMGQKGKNMSQSRYIPLFR